MSIKTEALSCKFAKIETGSLSQIGISENQNFLHHHTAHEI